jgi:hypothetical protein
VPDPNQRKELWEAERRLNEQEGTSSVGIAAMYVPLSVMMWHITNDVF